MSIPAIILDILKDHPEGLSAMNIVTEIKTKNLYDLPINHPELIIEKAINRHCRGIEKNCIFEDRCFSKTEKNGEFIYKLLSDAKLSNDSIAKNFVYPLHQVQKINDNATQTGINKSRILSEDLNVRALLSNYTFFVPSYQRSYSWKQNNIDEFMDDLFNILHASQEDARHFLGAITVVDKDGKKSDYDLIDGQQRITTILILLYVILGLYESHRFKDVATERANVLKRKVAFYNDDGEKIKDRLKLGEFNEEFFQKFVREGYSKTDQERFLIKTEFDDNNKFLQNQSIYDAFNRMKVIIEERLDSCGNEQIAFDYLKAIQGCLFDKFDVVVMTAEEEADAFLIFETLNDRGLALSSVDLIKNKLFQKFATHPTEFDTLKKEWEEMCDNIDDKGNLTKYILHYWRAFKGYTTPRTLYKTCRDYIESHDYNEAKAILMDLKSLSKYYNGFWNPMGNNPWSNDELKSTLEAMNKMNYELMHPILLAAVKKYPNDQNSLDKIAKLCFHFMIRYISINKNKPGQIEQEVSNIAQDASLCPNLLKTKFTALAPDGEFREELLKISMPYSLAITHYLLCVYEADGFNRNEKWQTVGRSVNTIEHILPQTVKSGNEHGDYWIHQFGSEDECKTYRERLGNYAFLTQKAQNKAVNKAFKYKKSVYENNSDMFLTKEVASCADWNLEEINKRQEKMADVLVNSISFNL